MKGIMPLMMMREQAGQRAAAAEAARAGAQQAGYAGALADVDRDISPETYARRAQHLGTLYSPGADESARRAVAGASDATLTAQQRLALFQEKIGEAEMGNLGPEAVAAMMALRFDPSELQQEEMEVTTLPSTSMTGVLEGYPGGAETRELLDPQQFDLGAQIQDMSTPAEPPAFVTPPTILQDPGVEEWTGQYEATPLLQDIGRLAGERRAGIEMEEERELRTVGRTRTAQLEAERPYAEIAANRDFIVRTLLQRWDNEADRIMAENADLHDISMSHAAALGTHEQMQTAIDNVARQVQGNIDSIRVSWGYESLTARDTWDDHTDPRSYLRQPVRIKFRDGTERILDPGWMGRILRAQNGIDIIAVIDAGTMSPQALSSAAATQQSLADAGYTVNLQMDPTQIDNKAAIDRTLDRLQKTAAGPVLELGQNAEQRAESQQTLTDMYKGRVTIVGRSEIVGGPPLDPATSTPQQQADWEAAQVEAARMEASGETQRNIDELQKIQGQYRQWLQSGALPVDPRTRAGYQAPLSDKEFLDQLKEALNLVGPGGAQPLPRSRQQGPTSWDR